MRSSFLCSKEKSKDKKAKTIIVILLLLALLAMLLFIKTLESDLIFNTLGGEEIDSVKINSEYVLPANPNRLGYTFQGWFFDENFNGDALTKISPTGKTINVYAKWQVNTYTLSFNTDGGNTINALTLDYNADINLPENPIKVGYSFGGWFNDQSWSTPFSLTNMPAEDITIYAKWNINTYNLSFVTDGGNIINPILFDFDEDIVLPPEPTFYGYTFDGWFNEASLSTPFIITNMPANNITLYAKWSLFNIGLLFEIINDSLPEEEQEYKVSIGTCEDSIIIIPKIYMGKPVVKIAAEGFSNLSQLISITIPSSIKHIGEYAFYNCPNLSNIEFNENSELISIDNRAFANLLSLIYFVIPSSVTVVGVNTLEGCDSLESLTAPFKPVYNESDNSYLRYYFGGTAWDTGHSIPSSLTTIIITEGTTGIADNAFRECSNLLEVRIPSSVIRIGDFAFAGNMDGWPTVTGDAMQLNVVFAENSELMIIGDGAFLHCENITEISIPRSVESIGNLAFYYTSLEHIDFEVNSNLISIGVHAFAELTSLFSITIPRTVEIIGEGAFLASSLESITFEENSSLKIIGNWSLSRTNLKTVKIPSSVETMEREAFYRCLLLESIFFEPNSVLSRIESYTFTLCSALTTMTIPGSVVNIGQRAFSQCSNLTIYTSFNNSLEGWHLEWNISNRPVVWQSTLSEDNTYVVSIDKGNIVNPSNDILNNPLREGYYFNGWYTIDNFSGTRYNTIEEAPVEILYAKWDEFKSYIVTFLDWDGTVLSSEELEYGAGATAPADPYRPPTSQYTFTFIGWDVNFDYIDGDLTVTALYEETINTYYIIFNTDGGDYIEPLPMEYGTEITSLPMPVKAEFVFAGWYEDALYTLPFDFNTEIVENTTIYAKWISDLAQLFMRFYDNFFEIWEIELIYISKDDYEDITNTSVEDVFGTNQIKNLIVFLEDYTVPLALEVEDVIAFNDINIDIQSKSRIFNKIMFSNYLSTFYIFTNNVEYREEHSAYMSIDGEVFIHYTGDSMEYIIPEGVTVIGAEAFLLKDMNIIIIPDTVSYIDEYAFFILDNIISIIIPATVTHMGFRAFYCFSLTFYVEAGIKPDGWSNDWNLNDFVIWGCTLSEDKTYLISFIKTNETQTYVSNPQRIGYTFEGWYTTDDFSGVKYDTIADAPNTVIYAKWEQ